MKTVEDYIEELMANNYKAIPVDLSGYPNPNDIIIRVKRIYSDFDIRADPTGQYWLSLSFDSMYERMFSALQFYHQQNKRKIEEEGLKLPKIFSLPKSVYDDLVGYVGFEDERWFSNVERRFINRENIYSIALIISTKKKDITITYYRKLEF